MKETSKSVPRRMQDIRFATRFIRGNGIDIGCGADPISLYAEIFPLMQSCRTWDMPDGDAQFMEGVEDSSYDFVHSSHCLEHMHDPTEALKNWFRILKQGGHLIILIPDEDLYEQGYFPSIFNSDHKCSFTIFKNQSWCPKSINVVEIIKTLGQQAEICKIELLDANYRYGLPSLDQTQTPIGESAIEFIIRKRTQREIDIKGRLPEKTRSYNPTEMLFLTGYKRENDITNNKRIIDEE